MSSFFSLQTLSDETNTDDNLDDEDEFEKSSKPNDEDEFEKSSKPKNVRKRDNPATTIKVKYIIYRFHTNFNKNIYSILYVRNLSSFFSLQTQICPHCSHGSIRGTYKTVMKHLHEKCKGNKEKRNSRYNQYILKDDTTVCIEISTSINFFHLNTSLSHFFHLNTSQIFFTEIQMSTVHNILADRGRNY